MPVAEQQINSLGVTLSVAPIGDEMLALAYLMMKRDDLLDTVFYQGVPSLSSFLELHKRPDVMYIGAFVQEFSSDQRQLAGMGWLFGITEEPGMRRSETGFVFFRPYMNHGIPLELTGMILDYVFGDLEFDIILGTTPVANRVALSFIRKLGFTQLPPVPLYCKWHGEPSSAVLSYLTSSMWLGRKEM